MIEKKNIEAIEKRVVEKIQTEEQAIRYKEALSLLDAEKSSADAIKAKFYSENKEIIDAAELLKSEHRAHIQKIDSLKKAIKSKIIEYQNAQKQAAVKQVAAQSVDDIIASALGTSQVNLTPQPVAPIVRTRKIWDYGVTDQQKFLLWCVKNVPELITISNKTKLIEAIKSDRKKTAGFVDIFEVEV